MSSELKSRSDWKNGSHFHPLSANEILQQVLERVAQCREAKPVLLLDLDSTVYEVGPRTHHIIREWLSTGPALQAPVQQALQGLAVDDLGYSIEDTFRRLGLSLENPHTQSVAATLKAFWWDRFFTNGYLKHDRTYPGAKEFVQEAYRLGALVCYLTGRGESRMREGTVLNLVRDALPFNCENTRLFMRTNETDSDVTHKTSAAKEIAKLGKLIASFENEPLNLVSLSHLFPEAMHVFVDTVCSHVPAPTGKNLYTLSSFEGFLKKPAGSETGSA